MAQEKLKDGREEVTEKCSNVKEQSFVAAETAAKE